MKGVHPKQVLKDCWLAAPALADQKPRQFVEAQTLATTTRAWAVPKAAVGIPLGTTVGPLPVNKIKIYRAFIARICRIEQDEALVGPIVTLGHKLDKRVLAECVETERQL